MRSLLGERKVLINEMGFSESGAWPHTTTLFFASWRSGPATNHRQHF
jgi:hypothetical protein